jgi:myo-inositol-1(or 4)-monophosphatase
MSAQILALLADALRQAADIARNVQSRGIEARRKKGGDPVTEADLEINRVLRDMLPAEGEGWLSEETADHPDRLGCERVWIVDPLDGTREFVAGIPEWCVSIGLVEAGRPLAGGIVNPATGELLLGAVGSGITLNGLPAKASACRDLSEARVLASRSEVNRGEWARFEGRGFEIRPMGSVAYKLALVAAGLADATWTLVPKNEWDVAAGVALVQAAGGEVFAPDGKPIGFNRPDPKLPGLVAVAPGLRAPVLGLLGK